MRSGRKGLNSLAHWVDAWCGGRKTREGVKKRILRRNSGESSAGVHKTRAGLCDGRGAMQIELSQLDRRYESLRMRSAVRERRLLASLAELGQQTPVVIVRDATRPVLVDGYKRVRALVRLGHDTVEAIEWELGESAAGPGR